MKVVGPDREERGYDTCRRIEVTKTNDDDDDDLDEPLGTPSCNLGEACESCQ